MLDQLKTCFREQSTALKFASEGKFFRKIQTSGLHGAYLEALEQGNASLDILLDNHKREIRNKMLSNLGHLNAENLLKNAKPIFLVSWPPPKIWKPYQRRMRMRPRKASTP